MTMIKPRVDHLLDHADSSYASVVVAARRARQINSYFNHLGEGLGAAVPPQVTSVARKPLTIAFEEIAADKIVPVDRTPEEMEAAQIEHDAVLAAELTNAIADE